MGESDEKRSNWNDLLARQRGANVFAFSLVEASASIQRQDHSRFTGASD